jgi:hypothetical protein
LLHSIIPLQDRLKWVVALNSMTKLGLDVELNGDSSSYGDDHAIPNQHQHPCDKIMSSPNSNLALHMPSIHNEKIESIIQS